MMKPVEEGTAAQDSLKPQNKSQMLGAALAKLAGLGIEDLSHFLNDTLAQVSNGNSAMNGGGAPDASSANQATLNMHPSAAKATMKEATEADLAAILGDGEDLSEEVKAQTAALFETAVEARVIVEREALVEEMNGKLEEAYEAIAEEMATKVDAYLDTVVEQWLVENEVAIESALRNEVVEDFIVGLKNLFAEHYVDMPEDKVDVVEELADKVANLEEQLDAAITKNAKLEEQILVGEAHDVIDSVCEGLALTQAEKLRSLCENVEFDGDLDGFTTKVKLVKENFLNKNTTPAPASGILTEESDPEAAANGNAPTPGQHPDVRRYAEAISRSVRKF